MRYTLDEDFKTQSIREVVCVVVHEEFQRNVYGVDDADQRVLDTLATVDVVTYRSHSILFSFPLFFYIVSILANVINKGIGWFFPMAS